MLNSFLIVLNVSRAGRSVWYDRHVGIVEAVGSNPARSIIKGETLSGPSPYFMVDISGFVAEWFEARSFWLQ